MASFPKRYCCISANSLAHLEMVTVFCYLESSPAEFPEKLDSNAMDAPSIGNRVPETINKKHQTSGAIRIEHDNNAPLHLYSPNYAMP